MTLAFGQLERVRAFAAQARCPQCDDWMIAPVSSEFVVGGEIRHHWECDGCGELTSTVIEIAHRKDEQRECAA